MLPHNKHSTSLPQFKRYAVKERIHFEVCFWRSCHVNCVRYMNKVVELNIMLYLFYFYVCFILDSKLGPQSLNR